MDQVKCVTLDHDSRLDIIHPHIYWKFFCSQRRPMRDSWNEP